MYEQTTENVYTEVIGRIDALIAGQSDSIAVMATVVCELHNSFDYFEWTGFYRVVEPGLLKVGPYQGPHGCLEIGFDRGICGAAARDGKTQIVADVAERPDYIACSPTTRSEIVVPVFDRTHRVRAVLDIDSDRVAAFGEIDSHYLKRVCQTVGAVLQV